MREQKPRVASCPAAGCWEGRARFEAKPPSARLRLVIWSSASHNPEETALTLTQPLLQAQDTFLSSEQPTHLELCTVLSCAAQEGLHCGFYMEWGWNGKAWVWPSCSEWQALVPTSQLKPSCADFGWGFQIWLMLCAVSNTHPSCCKRRNQDPVSPCTLMS